MGNGLYKGKNIEQYFGAENSQTTEFKIFTNN